MKLKRRCTRWRTFWQGVSNSNSLNCLITRKNQNKQLICQFFVLGVVHITDLRAKLHEKANFQQKA